MLRFSLTALFAACLCAGAMAGPSTPREADLRKLQEDVQLLKTQQQQILNSLNELVQIVKRGNEPPGVTPPETMSVAGELFRGNAAAPLAIIEYADFECPFCRRFHRDTYPQIGDAYVKTGKVRYFYRDLPLPFHQSALPAARAARCAAEQGKFWQMHDSLFAQDDSLTVSEIHRRAEQLGIDATKLDACVASDRSAGVIQQSMNDAAKMRIGGTPTFLIGTIAPNGNVVSVKATVMGAQPFDAFKSTIDALLGAAGGS